MATKVFSGFQDGWLNLATIPEQFFSELLPQIDHLVELKITLYTLWRLGQQEGAFHYMRLRDFRADEAFCAGLDQNPENWDLRLEDGLRRAAERGTILTVEDPKSSESLFFINSARGRAALEAIRGGTWRPDEDPDLLAVPVSEPGRLAAMYEANIGPLTPMIAEELQTAADEYPLSWIEEAFQIAISRNARNWRYIEAILERWQREGRDERKDRQDTEEARRRFFGGEFADYIEH